MLIILQVFRNVTLNRLSVYFYLSGSIQDSRLLYYLIREIKSWLNTLQVFSMLIMLQVFRNVILNWQGLFLKSRKQENQNMLQVFSMLIKLQVFRNVSLNWQVLFLNSKKQQNQNQNIQYRFTRKFVLWCTARNHCDEQLCDTFQLFTFFAFLLL